jgi:uncharacterized protein with HEPN domain
MTSPDFRVYLLHVRDCCEQLSKCRAHRERGGVPPSILFDAACRNLEIIGEASRRIGQEFRAAHPGYSPAQDERFNKVLIHNYEGGG